MVPIESFEQSKVNKAGAFADSTVSAVSPGLAGPAPRELGPGCGPQRSLAVAYYRDCFHLDQKIGISQAGHYHGGASGAALGR